MKSNYFYIIIGILFISIVFWRWFLGGFIYIGDTGYISHINISSYYHFFLWVGNMGLGSALAEIPRVLINGFVGRLSLRGLERNGSIIRLFFLAPYCILGFLGVYFLCSLYIKNKFLCMVGGILYVINTPVLLSLSMGHLHQIVPLGLFPWILLCLEYYVTTGYSIRYPIWILILLFISSIYEFRFAYIAFAVIIFYLCYHTILQKISFKRLTYTCIGLGLGFMCLNLYWLIPLIHIGMGDAEKLFLRGPFGDHFWDILNAIGQFHTYRNGSTPDIFVKQHIPVYFLILPLILFVGLYHSFQKSILFYYILLIVGILLVKQSGQPFPGLFHRLYNYIPGFNMFREGSRFFQLITLAYAIIIPFTLAKIYLRNSSSRLYYILLIGVLVYLFSIASPIFFGFNTTFFQPKYPDPEYSTITTYIDTQKQGFRILYVPRISNFMIYNTTHPGISYVDLAHRLGTGDIEKSISAFINTTGFDEWIDIAGIKYIVLDKHRSGKSDPFYRYETHQTYETILSNKSNLKKTIFAENQQIGVWENTGYASLIYGKPSVNYRFVNPTTYHLTFNISIEQTGFILYFLQSFHPGRKLYPESSIEGFKCMNTIYYTGNAEIMSGGVAYQCISTGTWGEREDFKYLYQTSIFEKSHTYIHQYANMRSIDLGSQDFLQQGIKNGWIVKNEFGGYNIHLVLYFYPQLRLYVGIFVSGLCFLFLIFYLCYIYFKD